MEMVSPAVFGINIAGGFIYAAAFILLLRILWVNKAHRNFIFAFSTIFSGVIASLYLINLVCVSQANHSLQGILFESAMLAPALIFFMASKKVLALEGGGNPQAVNAKFNELKDEFLTVASHELRTPLSIIGGFAEILIREKLGPLNDEQKRRVRKILMQGQRLNRIVDELLDLSRIRSGKVSVKKDIFDIVPVLKACFEDHILLFEQSQINYRENFSDVIPDILGDLDRVTQVVVNLLNNAIKYTPAGGIITLAAEVDSRGKFVAVSVIDTGIGIDASEQSLIFDEFYRSSDPTSRQRAGTGLGLAIVKQLVESQGGTIKVFSEGLGKGAKFTFTIPIAL